MLGDPHILEETVQRTLGVRLEMSVSTDAIDANTLSPDERRRYDQLISPSRKEAWLRGRAALKALLLRVGADADTARLTFPSPRYSLTHSGPYAVAVGVAEPTSQGIGVDLELQHAMRPEAARFFLTEEERRWLATRSTHLRAQALPRLWTVKEAVFKADINNEGRILADYRLALPGAANGVASVRDLYGVRSFRYTSVTLQQGFLSIAVRHDEEGAPWSTN